MSKTNVKAAESATAVAVDPFAALPVIKTSDGIEITDLTDATCTQPYKYADQHKRAIEAKSPMLVGYKHADKVLVPGTNRKEFKAGSVYGDIQQIVNAAGRGGIPVYALLGQLRRKQIGNKRSKYCEQLPPVGWAEGWLNTALTKNIVGVHATKTAKHFAPEAAEPEAKDGTNG